MAALIDIPGAASALEKINASIKAAGEAQAIRKAESEARIAEQTRKIEEREQAANEMREAKLAALAPKKTGNMALILAAGIVAYFIFKGK